MRKSGHRSNTALILKHSSDLALTDPRTDVAVPETHGGPLHGTTFTVNGNAENDELHDVTATNSSLEATNGNLFARLKVLVSPAP